MVTNSDGKVAVLPLKAAFEAVSPLIERYTSALCPSCENVCCIDRHGTYEEEDLMFMRAFGEEPPGVRPRDADTEPCRFLTLRGCLLPRWKRPFRCTWYFCPALLEFMPVGNPRQYRELVSALQILLSLRQGVVTWSCPGSCESG